MRKIMLSSLMLSLIFLNGPGLLSETEARPRPPGFHFWFHPFPFWVSPRVTIIHSDYGYLDLDVAPEEAAVSINGQHLGICDQFDGHPNYLYLKQGTYVIKFSLDGYEDYEQEILVLAGKELEFNTRLEKFTESSKQKQQEKISAPEPEPNKTRPEETSATDTGFIAFRIFPKDASIYIDDEFVGISQSVNALENGVTLASGSHTVAIMKPGYESYLQQIEVQAGETMHIRVILIHSVDTTI
ncbi:PEGA domain-containing protein [candidate division CSSED10-310 bacterium]|uniref:PEGA domain-containing protein n=1 Tax=candidate division CSSED10-310 bacterium TaxID=2855610 RepID=A0ABV6YVR3_UNCC1